MNELEKLRELKRGSAGHQNVGLMCADPPYTTRIARGHAICAQEIFRKENTENAVKLVCSMTASREYGQIFVQI